jgi:hypothetical protein
MVLTLAFVLLASFAFAADFSGEWKLDKSKSDLGEGRGRFNATKLVVKLDDEKIVIERTGQGRNGEITREEILTLDGKENELEGFRGSTRTVTAKWDEKKETLSISSFMKMERNGETFEITSNEVWKLDGKELVLNSEMKSPRGERKSKLVYGK